jgi:hypothetical protein
MTGERCTWCGTRVETDDGWRAGEAAGERRAAFCRLEHVFPGGAQGPHLTECAQCGGPLPDTYVLLVRHRGDHRIPDGFCSVAHMAEWAKRGGRWAP